MSRKRAILAFVVAGVLCPVSARADVGTPLVWASAFHLFLGNALIGVFEGWLLARAFGLPKRRCIWSLVLANYLSAWIGIGLMPFFFQKYGMDIYSGLSVTWALVAATYLLTLLLEWPFVALCFRKAPGWFPQSVKGSLLIQSASYILLFGGYWLVSGTSLYMGMRLIPPEQISAPSGIVMFFISSSDGDIYRTELGTKVDAKIVKLGSTNYYDDHLELRESETDTNLWDIAAVFDRRQQRVVIPHVSTKDQIPDKEGWKTSQYCGWGVAPSLASDVENSSWRFGWAHWPDIGMWASNGSKTIRVAYGTPFGGYTPYRVIQLPGDKALLQLDEQICLVDIPAKKVARIRKGYGMLAFRKNQIVELSTGGNAE